MADLYSTNPYINGGAYPYGTAAWANMYNNQVPQAQQPQQSHSGYTVRESGGVAEVLAQQIALGTTNVFLNLPSGEIYVSRHDNMGKKEVSVFKFEQFVQPTINNPTPSSMDLSGVNGRLDKLESMLSQFLGGKQDESDANNAPAAKRSKSASRDTTTNTGNASTSAE